MLEREEKSHRNSAEDEHQCFISLCDFLSYAINHRNIFDALSRKKQHIRGSKSSISSVMISTVSHFGSNQPQLQSHGFQAKPSLIQMKSKPLNTSKRLAIFAQEGPKAEMSRLCLELHAGIAEIHVHGTALQPTSTPRILGCLTISVLLHLFLPPGFFSCIQGLQTQMDKEGVVTGYEMKDYRGLAAASAQRDSQSHKQKPSHKGVAYISGCLMPLS